MISNRNFRSLCLGAVLTVSVLSLDSCRRDMNYGYRYPPDRPAPLFPNQSSSRFPPGGTVKRLGRGALPEASAIIDTGRANGQMINALPIPLTRSLLEKGQERYSIYCEPCHGLTGQGDGMIVQRGFPRPPSFQDERLRREPDGYLFSIATNGFRRMPSYMKQTTPRERWAIVAYIRALQLSEHATLKDVPQDIASKLQNAAASTSIPQLGGQP